jgi:hypothetical protein
VRKERSINEAASIDWGCLSFNSNDRRCDGQILQNLDTARSSLA